MKINKTTFSRLKTNSNLMKFKNIETNGVIKVEFIFNLVLKFIKKTQSNKLLIAAHHQIYTNNIICSIFLNF